ncbi:helix-turn-helix transcriptional regulator [Brevibacillus dissolubilis]|uniref:helix-turn-helix transcriptional regulator n=1 Tax=Brevibacillus dissolubilis TaxID=1844116 RepID=UPI0021004053|nr:helix-turn-helix domain-containing protein [Brevibacillus dissolubilis]
MEFTQEQFAAMISEKCKLIRTEAGYTQDRMAEIVGLSKKTLVQVEKGRQALNFTAAALIAVLFRRGEIIQSMYGDSVLEIVDLVSTKTTSKAWYKTMGGKVWWNEMRKTAHFCLQKHVLTGHYRILDHADYLHYYSMDEEESYARLQELEKGREQHE